MPENHFTDPIATFMSKADIESRYLCAGCITWLREVLAAAITATGDVAPERSERSEHACPRCGSRHERTYHVGTLVVDRTTKRPGIVMSWRIFNSPLAYTIELAPSGPFGWSRTIRYPCDVDKYVAPHESPVQEASS